MQIISFRPGNYSYLPAGFQYSAAVVAEKGFIIERARLDRPIELEQAFELMREHLIGIGRPLTALCACELRSAAPMTEAEFVKFNRSYVKILEGWGIFEAEVNPVARCNLIPTDNRPRRPSIYAFSYTVPTDKIMTLPDFKTSGAAECPDRPGYRHNIVRLGEVTPDALSDKLKYAVSDINHRLLAMGVSWSDIRNIHLYSVHDLHEIMHRQLLGAGVAGGGISWHCVRPPVEDIEIEIDVARISSQILIEVSKRHVSHG